jgi:hypothetical protein
MGVIWLHHILRLMKSWLKVFSRKTSYTLHVMRNEVELVYYAPIVAVISCVLLRLSKCERGCRRIVAVSSDKLRNSLLYCGITIDNVNAAVLSLWFGLLELQNRLI